MGVSTFPAPPTSTPATTRAVGDWYLANARDLPWRAGVSPWQILVSEVMAQQTPVARVEPIWQRWRELWPTPAHLAAAAPDQVLRQWKSLGYPRRALRLQECAAALVRDHNGEIPDTYDELLALPGIGQYTAGAILAFAFGKRALVLDTNVRRVIARVFLGLQFPPPQLSSAEKAFATALMPVTDADASLWAQASMELGATLCTAKKVACAPCPVASSCRWRALGYPPDERASERKTQKFTGTDRQVRGLIMQAIRASDSPVPRAHIDLVWPDAAQLGRCVDGLVLDGLIEVDGDLVAFPS